MRWIFLPNVGLNNVAEPKQSSKLISQINFVLRKIDRAKSWLKHRDLKCRSYINNLSNFKRFIRYGRRIFNVIVAIHDVVFVNWRKSHFERRFNVKERSNFAESNLFFHIPFVTKFLTYPWLSWRSLAVSKFLPEFCCWQSATKCWNKK